MTEQWPELPLEAWQDTHDTLHMWLQIVGKVKLALCPFVNEWWEVAFYVTARGLTTGTIPRDTGVFQIDFDFIDHNLFISSSDGAVKALPLYPRSVADFYGEFMACLEALGIQVTFNTLPSEVPNPIRFQDDTTHASYDAGSAHRWWRIMLESSKVFERYRSRFAGKASPVQFFWGTYDLSETRFSGRPAAPPAGADVIMRFSEDEENIAAGFWPGDAKLQAPAYYSYIYPEPDGYKTATVKPSAAHYDSTLGEFVLLYEDVRKADSPEDAILEFLQSTYEAGATLGHWDRQRLERKETPPKG